MYADFEFYQSSYGSSLISQEEFMALERQASLHVDLLTFNRLKNGWNVTDDVKTAVCAVAEVVKKYEAVHAQAITAVGIKSENNDGYSVSYQDSADIKSAMQSAMTDAAYPYLIYTGLMDRGIGRCCR
ncbi:hypothetical protein [Scatolibacter rhodanostii]|uniref:hypothetical protein n=1 Tax=Scatolibacter rhodanostii TaxID=2014781 RepID=UPI000C074642|nr:hypothetical protein [Scatolibacter rhodanostii]